MITEEPEPLPFPVLGIPPSSWLGYRTLAMHGGTRQRDDSGAFGASRIVSLMHAYYLPNQRLPTLIIGQAPVYADDEPSSRPPWPSLLRLLRRRVDAPQIDAPSAASARFTARIGGQDVDALRLHWPDARVNHVRFVWQGSRRVEVASWLWPLDPAFFNQLGEIASPLAKRAGPDSQPPRCAP